MSQLNRCAEELCDTLNCNSTKVKLYEAGKSGVDVKKFVCVLHMTSQDLTPIGCIYTYAVPDVKV